MKKYIYGIGTAALALAMSGLPAVAFAQDGGGEGASGVSATAQVTAQVQVQGQRPSIVGSSEEGSEANQSSSTEAAQRVGEQGREAAKQVAEQVREGVKNAAERTLEMMKEGLPFSLESTTTAALSFGQLKQSIEARSQELDQEEASSSPEARAIMKNVNPVRLAVHALLASKDLVGGIGAQVSQVAQQINDSVASTTAAEAQIQSRGFFTKLLFGGDSMAAQVITEQVAQNQQRIDDLTKLLGQANISADVQATLQAQITALQAAQTRLQALAQQEQSTWGLFSWRF